MLGPWDYRTLGPDDPRTVGPYIRHSKGTREDLFVIFFVSFLSSINHVFEFYTAVLSIFDLKDGFYAKKQLHR